jgi:hypothetical protein
MSEWQEEVEYLDMKEKVKDFLDLCYGVYSFYYWCGFKKQEVKKTPLHFKLTFCDGELDLSWVSSVALNYVYDTNNEKFIYNATRELARKAFFEGRTYFAQLYEKHMGKTTEEGLDEYLKFSRRRG